MRKFREMLICTAIAIVIGVQLGFVSGFFGRLLDFIEPFCAKHYIILLPFLGVAGVVIIWLYKHISPNSEQGLNLAIAYNMGEVGEHGEVKDVGHAHKIGEYPNAYVILKLAANAIMLLFGASTGKEGTVAACGAAIGDYTSRWFRLRKYSHILLISGVSAAVSGLFHTPLGGLFFSLEFSAVGLLYYQALIPALTASYVSYYISTVCGFNAFHYTVQTAFEPDILHIALILVAAVIFGLAGRAFVFCLENAKKLYNDHISNRYTGALVGGSVIAALMIIFRARYCGTGGAMVEEIFFNRNALPYDFALKAIFTVLCITIGFSGGEMMPLMAIGASLGAVVSSLFGLPFELTVALGCAAVYCSATNTLLAPVFIGIEMFGTGTALYMAAVCIVAFAVNGNHSVYTMQGHIPRSVYGALRHK